MKRQIQTQNEETNNLTPFFNQLVALMFNQMLSLICYVLTGGKTIVGYISSERRKVRTNTILQFELKVETTFKEEQEEERDYSLKVKLI